MIDLTKFIGKRCVVQLKNVWLVCHQAKGRVEIMVVKGEGGAPTAVPVPFLTGEVVGDASMASIRIQDENQQNLEVTLDPDQISSVTVACEASRVQLVGG